MLTVRKLGMAQASTYYSKDNYYTKQQGEYFGKLKSELGLNDLTHESFIQLLNGIHPSTGESLVSSKEGKEANIPAFDFTFSPPKSLSIVYEAALAKGDFTTASLIVKVHDNAVNTALSHVEDEEIKARVQKNSKRKSVSTGSMIAAKFQHDINRALEPQLHTHSVIFNMTKCEDGKYRALDVSHLLKKNSPIIKSLGQYYRESLKQELKKVDFELRNTDQEKSFYELEGVSDDLILAISSRSKAIKAKAKELKKEFPTLSDSQLSLRAFFNTRVSKKEVDRDEVRLNNAELISQHVDIDKLLSALKTKDKPVLQQEPIPKIDEEELKALIHTAQKELKKWQRAPLNVTTKVLANLPANSISIQALHVKVKAQQQEERKTLNTMHEVVIFSLKTTKLDTQKLFAKIEELKSVPKIQIEETIENARTAGDRDRFIESYLTISSEFSRTKSTHHRDVISIDTTTERGGIRRTDIERDGVNGTRTEPTNTQDPNTRVTMADIRLAEQGYKEHVEHERLKIENQQER